MRENLFGLLFAGLLTIGCAVAPGCADETGDEEIGSFDEYALKGGKKLDGGTDRCKCKKEKPDAGRGADRDEDSDELTVDRDVDGDESETDKVTKAKKLDAGAAEDCTCEPDDEGRGKSERPDGGRGRKGLGGKGASKHLDAGV